MKDNYIYRILNQFFTYSYPSEMEEKVQKWIVNDRWSEEKENALSTIWNEIQVAPNAKTYHSLDKVKKTIGLEEKPKLLLKHNRRWLKYAAAVIPLFLLVGWYLYNSQNLKTIEIVTANNEQRQCTLPDGTTVLLNSDTKLTYPSTFKDATRVVTLEGEAYFSVISNSSQPFIVTTHKLSVRVLGTKFNLSAYPMDDRVITTLNSGSIQVHIESGESDSQYILKPSQQIVYDKIDKSVLVNTVTDESVGWKDGLLIFQDATFNDIVHTLQRRFNVTIRYDKQKFANDPYTIKFINHETLEDILHVLQDVMGDFTYAIQTNQVTLIKKEVNKNR
ncbi:FecR family protein [Bacteroides sp.]|uniref:FecR family protein n=1 Tax=Bacteroides sp. TaxID=29523 RepID=UPI0026376E03|nr:FecR family protein [Bacteroides sp.]MDD3037676.1 FecR domain-containing protein [Bacteroides sp.]